MLSSDDDGYEECHFHHGYFLSFTITHSKHTRYFIPVLILRMYSPNAYEVVKDLLVVLPSSTSPGGEPDSAEDLELRTARLFANLIHRILKRDGLYRTIYDGSQSNSSTDLILPDKEKHWQKVRPDTQRVENENDEQYNERMKAVKNMTTETVAGNDFEWIRCAIIAARALEYLFKNRDEPNVKQIPAILEDEPIVEKKMKLLYWHTWFCLNRGNGLSFIDPPLAFSFI